MTRHKGVFWRHKAPKRDITGTAARLASTTISRQPRAICLVAPLVRPKTSSEAETTISTIMIAAVRGRSAAHRGQTISAIWF